jgi:hypothetical protein
VILPDFSTAWIRRPTALELLKFLSSEVAMTKEKWLLLGALIVGLLVVLYVVFLCPSDCH